MTLHAEMLSQFMGIMWHTCVQLGIKRQQKVVPLKSAASIG